VRLRSRRKSGGLRRCSCRGDGQDEQREQRLKDTCNAQITKRKPFAAVEFPTCSPSRERERPPRKRRRCQGAKKTTERHRTIPEICDQIKTNHKKCRGDLHLRSVRNFGVCCHATSECRGCKAEKDRDGHRRQAACTAHSLNDFE
jgi:hypothetical protein